MKLKSGYLELQFSVLNSLIRVIVKYIISRNVIINRGAAEVDNHISRDDIFDYHPIRECNIRFIIPSNRSFMFYRLRPTMVGEFKRGNNAQSLIYMHE